MCTCNQIKIKVQQARVAITIVAVVLSCSMIVFPHMWYFQFDFPAWIDLIYIYTQDLMKYNVMIMYSCMTQTIVTCTYNTSFLFTGMNTVCMFASYNNY